MSLRSLLALAVGGSAGFLAARALLDPPEAAQRLPEPVQARARAGHDALARARARAYDAIAAASEAAAQAQRELLADYHRKVGRYPRPATPAGARGAFARLTRGD